MRLILLSVLVAIPFLATAQKELPRHKQPKQSKTDKDVWNITYNDGLLLDYKQAKDLLSDTEKEGSLKMWDAARLEEEKKGIPAGGFMIFTLSRNALEKARPENLTIVVQDPEGKEVSRFEPKPGVPKLNFYGGNPVYHSIVVVPVATPLASGSKVFVAESYEKLRFEYEVKPL